MAVAQGNYGRRGRSGGFRSQKWQKDPSAEKRTGSGIKYGALDLTPKNNYTLASPRAHEGKLRIAVMGGNEEVGRNMTLLEYGNDIILIDMGIQFGEEHMRGIDGIVQDFSYLKGREKDVKAVIITHMHMDHIGAIPYIMPMLPGVPVFSAPITLALIAKKLEYTPEVKVDLRAIDEQTVLQLGNFKATFIGVSHSVPSALAVVLDTPCGKIVHTGDFKIDLQPQDPDAVRYLDQMKQLGKQNILALLSDSTNASQGGHQIMEHEVTRDLDMLVRDAKGRLLFGMISSNVVRLAQIITLAEKYGRYVVVGGKSLKTTLEIAENLGYISPRPGTLIDIEEVNSLPPNKIVAIFPGAQGESNAAFYKLASNELKDMRVVPGDTVVFSSSVIPGNERTVQFITDRFYRLGAKVLNYRALNIHSGGHAKAADLGDVVAMVKPKYLVPIEGHVAFLHHHAIAAMAAGFSRDKIFIADNGQVIEFDKEGRGALLKERVPTRHIYVDGKTLDAIDADTLRERKRLGDEGIIIISAVRTAEGLKQMHVSSLGVRKAALVQKLHSDIEKAVLHEYKNLHTLTNDKVAQALDDRLTDLITKKTGMSPYFMFQFV